VEYSYFGTKSVDLRVEQGYEIGRPSLLFIKAVEEHGQIKVQVGGRCIPLAQGQFG